MDSIAKTISVFNMEIRRLIYGPFSRPYKVLISTIPMAKNTQNILKTFGQLSLKRNLPKTETTKNGRIVGGGV